MHWQISSEMGGLARQRRRKWLAGGGPGTPSDLPDTSSPSSSLQGWWGVRARIFVPARRFGSRRVLPRAARAGRSGLLFVPDPWASFPPVPCFLQPDGARVRRRIRPHGDGPRTTRFGPDARVPGTGWPIGSAQRIPSPTAPPVSMGWGESGRLRAKAIPFFGFGGRPRAGRQPWEPAQPAPPAPAPVPAPAARPAVATEMHGMGMDMLNPAMVWAFSRPVEAMVQRTKVLNREEQRKSLRDQIQEDVYFMQQAWRVPAHILGPQC